MARLGRIQALVLKGEGRKRSLAQVLEEAVGAGGAGGCKFDYREPNYLQSIEGAVAEMGVSCKVLDQDHR